MPEENDFYEDDEPIDEIVSAFNTGVRGVTRRPGLNIVISTTNIGNSTCDFPWAVQFFPLMGTPVGSWVEPAANQGGGVPLAQPV